MDWAVTPAWCREMEKKLEAATCEGVDACRGALPPAELARLLSDAADLLEAEPTLLEVRGWQCARRGCKDSTCAVCMHASSTRACLRACVFLSARAHHTSMFDQVARCARFLNCTSPAQLGAPILGGRPVIVVGDTHGQFHDTLHM